MMPPPPIELSEALARIEAVAGARVLPVETVSSAAAHGRIAGEDVRAPVALPMFDNAAMDGFALRAADAALAQREGLLLTGDRFAGASGDIACAAGMAVRITTGAAIPPGADAVVPKEDVDLVDGRVRIRGDVVQGHHVRRAGEDVAVGDAVLHAGQRIGASEVAVLAALGVAQVSVRRRPTVAVFTTGDELREPGETLRPGEIHDSNRPMLRALLAEAGYGSVAWPSLPDDAERIASALRDAAEQFDVVLTCGGASVGERDHLPALLEGNGRVHFWRVRIKPGMPVLFGELGGALLCSLPGNPVSVFATFHAIAKPLLDRLAGRAPAPPLVARLAEAIDKPHARHELRRGHLRCTDDGALEVSAHPRTGSHHLSGLLQGNCLFEIDADAHALGAGTPVRVIPYDDIRRP